MPVQAQRKMRSAILATTKQMLFTLRLKQYSSHRRRFFNQLGTKSGNLGIKV